MKKDFNPTGFVWYTTNMAAVSSFFFTPIIGPSKSQSSKYYSTANGNHNGDDNEKGEKQSV